MEKIFKRIILTLISSVVIFPLLIYGELFKQNDFSVVIVGSFLTVLVWYIIGEN